MIALRTWIGLGFAASLTFLAGCGGSSPETDTAEIIRNDPSTKDAPAPAPKPEAAPAKDAPKG
jgi:hypothetical protein